MDIKQFQKKIKKLLDSTLDEGPGTDAAALITATELFYFVRSVNGAETPRAVGYIVKHLEAHVESYVAVPVPRTRRHRPDNVWEYELLEAIIKPLGADHASIDA
jgi:hypothetical protein